MAQFGEARSEILHYGSINLSEHTCVANPSQAPEDPLVSLPGTTSISPTKGES